MTTCVDPVCVLRGAAFKAEPAGVCGTAVVGGGLFVATRDGAIKGLPVFAGLVPSADIREALERDALVTQSHYDGEVGAVHGGGRGRGLGCGSPSNSDVCGYVGMWVWMCFPSVGAICTAWLTGCTCCWSWSCFSVCDIDSCGV